MSTTKDEHAAAVDRFPIIRVFGGVSVDDVDGPVSIGGPRQRRLLALLAIRAGSVVSIDWLAEYLWNDDERPAATARALRTYLSRLRQALPAAAQEWIETEPAGYRLTAPDDALEHRRFAALRAAATEARGHDDPQTALRHLDEALASWSGDPFRELEDLDWALAEIEQLRLDRLEMLEERWEVSLALGRHTQITGELAAFTAEHGLRDRAARQFALALHRSGRTAEALRVIDDHRRRLADETGLDPSTAIVELERAMLVGDPSLDAERVGRPLRGYRLLEEAGSGAFAIVWRGIQPSVEREVAIKQIRAELASQPDFIRRFEAEAHLVARIEHPHIVPLIDYWRDPDSAYLVMRWMRGGTLERRLDDGPLGVDDTLTLARQIGGALATAHAHGVVHRDVKTGNILFDEAGNAFLGDFGIALEAAESAGPEAALSPGSPAYSSPEQIRREPLGPAADVFSLGVVVFECLAGMLPFRDSSSLDELLDRQLNDPYPALSEFRTDVPQRIVDAVARATAKEPSARFADIAAFLAALDAPAAAEPVAPSAAEPAALPDDLENPYLGLRAFDDADADRFFGRDRLVSELLDRLDDGTIRSRCVVIVGPSGSGKSSLARAGVVPAIRAGAVPGSSDWYVSTMVPGNDPFESLEIALLRIAVNPPVTLLDQLRDGERGILRSVRRCLASDRDRVLLVIDQFEEVFVGASADVAHDFLRALATTVEDPTSPVRIVITLRADFYDRPLAHPQFASVLKETAVDVTPLAPDELERAVVEPARRVGVELEPGLAARIAAESTGQPAPLPLLQYALAELFERRDGSRLTVAAYDEIGGLTGALTARAESIHADADDAQRAAIRQAFGRMTDPGEASADLRRRVPIGDLGDDDATAWVLERYGAARLITFGRDGTTRAPTVEVAHEALLREWPRLAGWLRDDIETLRLAQAIGGAADAWDRSDRPASDLYRGGRLDTAVGLAMSSPERLRPLDREFLDASRAAADHEQDAERLRVRRLRRLVVATGIALVVAVVAGAVALIQRNDAQSAQREAELATLISRSAAVGAEDPELALLLALEANRRAPARATEQAVLDALGATTIANRVSSLAPLAEFDGPCEPVSMTNSDGTISFATVDGQLVGRDTVSGDVVEYGAPPEPCVIWMADREADRRWATTFDGTRMWFGPYDGPWGPAQTIDTPQTLLKSSFRPNHRLVVGTADDAGVAGVSLLDDRTGERVGTPVALGRDYGGVEVNDPGSLVAVGLAPPDPAD
ncbi:protein kinase domain-containing protein, partial [Ilumatobacter sp.]|uniref:nSTAND1 domain-containing NTPase n=1 Tax=Ilumatobacter sp. TaxID=1967498 RepID=UPI003AF45FF1